MKRKILVVDDNRLNVNIITDLLEAEGYDVYSLLDGLKVMDTVLTIQPDAILLDIVMPNVDGFEVCSELKMREDTKNIPVIMVTALSEATLLRKAFDLGAFDYIKKPFDQIEIIARLKSALRYSTQQKLLEDLAMKDGLTNLYNHRLIMELLEKECSKAVRNNLSLAFLMFDIDFFKKVNDSFGHKSGDFVLKKLAEILMEHSRTGDLIGRYGGEEFCMIIPDQSLESVLSFSNRLRIAIELHPFEIEGYAPIHITASIGIAYKASLSNIGHNDLITISDKKLYEAKDTGRNKIEFQIIES